MLVKAIPCVKLYPERTDLPQESIVPYCFIHVHDVLVGSLGAKVLKG